MHTRTQKHTHTKHTHTVAAAAAASDALPFPNHARVICPDTHAATAAVRLDREGCGQTLTKHG
jgi:hypothetical protein